LWPRFLQGDDLLDDTDDPLEEARAAVVTPRRSRSRQYRKEDKKENGKTT